MTITTVVHGAADDVEKTARDINRAIWGVAAVVMVGSAAAAGYAFHDLGEFWGLGVLTAAGVDLSLATWLRISRRLRDADVTAVCGLALEFITAGMTLFLNIGAAVFQGIKPHSPEALQLLGVAHSFLPIILIVLSLAGAEALHKLGHVKRVRKAAEQAARDAEARQRDAAALSQQRALEQQALAQSRGELVTAQDYARKAGELRRQAEADRRLAQQDLQQAQADHASTVATRAATSDELAATRAATRELQKAQQEHAAAGPPASREQRREWVRCYVRDKGVFPRPSEVDAVFVRPRTGSAVIAEVKKEHANVKQIRVAGGRS